MKILLLFSFLISFLLSNEIQNDTSDSQNADKFYYKLWRDDPYGCKGLRYKCVDKLFPELMPGIEIRPQSKYNGFTKEKIIKLFGKSEKIGKSDDYDTFQYFLLCETTETTQIIIYFENNKVVGVKYWIYCAGR